MTEILRQTWAIFTGWQKLVVGLILAVVILGGAGLAVSNAIGWGRVTIAEWKASAAEARAVKAEAQMNEWIAKAAIVSSKLQAMEKDLAKTEGKRDETKIEADAADKRVSDDRANYNRAVEQPRTDDPGTEQLCRELAELGYPCNDAQR